MLRSLVREVSRFRAQRRIREAERRRQAGDPRGALAWLPDASDPEAFAVRGLALRDLGDAPGAIAALESSLLLHGDNAEVLNELGVLLLGNRNESRARSLFERAAELAPGLASPLANLAVLQLRSRRPLEAIALLERAIDRNPDDLSCWMNLVSALRDADELEKAELRLTEAEARFPGRPEIEFRKATLEREMGAASQARERLERLLSRDPQHMGSRRMLLGMVLQDLGDYAAAEACFDSILKRFPGHPHTRFLKGILALLQGNFQTGWDDYEARFQTDESPDRGFPFPAWDGQPMAGNLLVYAEQGVGDEIMFASCLHDAIRRCGRVFLQCDPRLQKLFARSFPDATIIGAARSDADWLGTLPPIGAKVAAGSLPAFFRRERLAFEGRSPYLAASAERIAHWRRRLASLGPGPYVGLSWRGGIAKTRRMVRSVPLAAWKQVLAAPATWVSLQHDSRAEEIDELNSYARVLAWPELFLDLDDVAALVCALDAVVSVCNSTVHLAGALGTPTTALVPSAPEWRYGAAGDGMPWYASVRLLRQERGESWDRVLSIAARTVDGSE